MIQKFNDPQYIDFFEDKTKFAEKFAPFFKRKWLSTKDLTEEKLRSFVQGIDSQFIYKPVGNAQGQGIRVFSSEENVSRLYQEITAHSEVAILEQWIEQHPALAEIYSEAINCLRIITVLKNDKLHYLTGGITWGNGKKIANASASGIVSPVDFATGILAKPAADFHGHSYSRHPISGAMMVNFQVPFWKETLEMLECAARIIPQVGYVGWDIAITPTGPVIIEGNTTPGYKYYQIPEHLLPDKYGNRKIYQELL